MTYIKITKKILKVGIVKILMGVLALFSLKNSHRLGTFIGWLSSITPNRSRFVTEKNIQLCFPNLDSQQQQQLMRKTLIETGKTLTEASLMWQWNKNKLFRLIKKVHGEELLHNAIINKHGVVIALPHLGNWELVSLYCSANYRTTTMYQNPKMSQLGAAIKTGRERLGANLVPTSTVGVRAMLSVLKKNEFVVILPDQEPSIGSGVFVPFFGLQAYSMTLISRLTKKTKAQVVIAYAKRLPNAEGYEIFFTDLPEMSEKINSDLIEDSVGYLNSEVEKCIRSIPEQYQWSYKRFRKQPVIKDERITGKDFYNP